MPGVNTIIALIFLAIVGLDLNCWRDAKAFTSWLGLSPLNKISGGRMLSSRTKRCRNRLAIALRVAAQSLHNDKTAIGAFLRRLKRKKGAPIAITATARKIAVILYTMITEKKEYHELGQHFYEERYKKNVTNNAIKTLKRLGYSVKIEEVAA